LNSKDCQKQKLVPDARTKSTSTMVENAESEAGPLTRRNG
jgi:hypothetical protein